MSLLLWALPLSMEDEALASPPVLMEEGFITGSELNCTGQEEAGRLDMLVEGELLVDGELLVEWELLVEERWDFLPEEAGELVGRWE